jgi:hypothetical protein
MSKKVLDELKWHPEKSFFVIERDNREEEKPFQRQDKCFYRLGGEFRN